MLTTTDSAATAAEITATERAALERWNRGDIAGLLAIYADDVTFFDPITEKRFDGKQVVADYFYRFYAGKINILRYEILNPQVIVEGELAVLSYNLKNYVRAADGIEKPGTPWNSTQVYRRIDNRWRAVHVHWSFTKHPAFQNMSPEAFESANT
ncbi:MAG: DUF4440 domain-containing protein [Acidobacteria bacterium]|nr:DUF4440 domain-containing protein [Acidobacteriota bacterium]